MVDEDTYINQETIELREKQATCSHPSFRCSLCKLYRDNVNSQYRQIIRELLRKLETTQDNDDRVVVKIKYEIFFKDKNDMV